MKQPIEILLLEIKERATGIVRDTSPEDMKRVKALPNVLSVEV
ncbi:hypothetical protein [Effusibacillus lacus]|nr:hypothetical protein [Effusibacillus lacus]TCS75170.1 hypothetical protein EDD64_10999 [Effusibacillus lacus]